MSDAGGWDNYSDCSEELEEEIKKTVQDKLVQSPEADKPHSSTNVVNPTLIY
jgi:hypothetical protein